MCLLVFMPEGKTASKEALETASYYNDDGFGWAIRTPDKILVGKNMDFQKAYDEFIAARSSYNGDALFHLRITTHGATDLENCHPFYVGKDSLSVVAHNGMLPVPQPKGDTRSDTRIFAETLLPKRGGIAFLNGKGSLTELEKWAAGSKLVFLTANPASKWRYVIANMEDGDWGKDDNEGVWFSNNSYKYARSTTRMYSGGWDYSTIYSMDSGYSYNPANYTEGATKNVVRRGTSLQEVLDMELQHHAYELAESMLAMNGAQDDTMWEDDPTSGMKFYDSAEELITRWDKIYKPYNDSTYTATCARCGDDFFLDHADIPATHCPSCDCCLYCGSDPVPSEAGHASDCCEWPMGYYMSYAPETVQLVKGGDTNVKEVPSLF